MLRSIIIGSVRLVLRLYFRTIEVTGQVPDETVSGRLFYGNHHNGLIDPALVVARAPSRMAPMSPLAKAPLWKIAIMRPFLSAARALPVQRRQDNDGEPIDNRAIFARVIEALERGGNVLVFPEGISHSAPGLAPFKTGAARMMLDTSPAAPVTVQPIHLRFDRKATFRSRALIHYGQPFEIAPWRTEGGSDDREAVAALTGAMTEALDEIVALAGDWEEQRLLERVALLAATPSADTEADGQTMRARHVAFLRARRGYQALVDTEHPELPAVRARLEAYFERLLAAGIDDHDVVGRHDRGAVVEAFARLGFVGVTLPFSLAGCALFAPSYYFVRWASGRFAKSEDEISSVKVLAAYVAYPLAFGTWSGVALVTLGPGVIVAVPLILGAGLAAMALLDQLEDLGSLRAWLAFRLRSRATLDALRTERDAIVDDLAALETEVDALELVNDGSLEA